MLWEVANTVSLVGLNDRLGGGGLGKYAFGLQTFAVNHFKSVLKRFCTLSAI